MPLQAITSEASKVALCDQFTILRGREGREKGGGGYDERVHSVTTLQSLQVPASPCKSPSPSNNRRKQGHETRQALVPFQRESLASSLTRSLAHSASPTLTREVSNKTSRDILVCYRIGPQILWQSAQRSLEPFQPPWFRL